MPEWLHNAFVTDAELPAPVQAVRLAAALALGCVVAGIYRLTRRPLSGDATSLVPTLVLLTILIAMVTMVIGNRANSVALAFSLVGALAIVRFRTVVEDTRDTVFVIFAVAVGMAVGTGLVTVPLVGIPVAAAAAFVFRPRGGPHSGAGDYTLTVRVGVGHSPDGLLREAFGKHLTFARLAATMTARQGVALELTYRVRLRQEDGALALVAELNGVEGIQNVELRQA